MEFQFILLQYKCGQCKCKASNMCNWGWQRAWMAQPPMDCVARKPPLAGCNSIRVTTSTSSKLVSIITSLTDPNHHKTINQLFLLKFIFLNIWDVVELYSGILQFYANSERESTSLERIICELTLVMHNLNLILRLISYDLFLDHVSLLRNNIRPMPSNSMQLHLCLIFWFSWLFLCALQTRMYKRQGGRQGHTFIFLKKIRCE